MTDGLRPAPILTRPGDGSGGRISEAAISGPDLVAGGALAVSVVLWFFGLQGADPRAMTDLGLVSILSPVSYIALAVLVAGFSYSLLRSPPASRVPLIYPLAFVVMVHGAPSLLYGTLRYAWAWKHVGVVDFIQRTGTVDPTIGALEVYHNWPGLFALTAALNHRGDALALAEVARWAPLFFNLLFFVALITLVRRLTSEPRQAALTVWIFFLASWVGQDYFSPQAFAYFLYLALLGVVLGAFVTRAPVSAPRHRPTRSDPLRRRLRRWIRRWRRALQLRLADPPLAVDPYPSLRWYSLSRRDRAITTSAVIIVVSAIIVTHQLTPLPVLMAVGFLVVLGYVRPRSLPVLVGVLTVGWLVTGASSFVLSNADELRNVGDVSANVSGTLADLSQMSDGQLVVSAAARLLVVTMTALTVYGVVRARRHGLPMTVPAILAATPLVLVALTSYGSEILFRVYLFALPGAAFLTAGGLLVRRSPKRAVALVAAVSAMLVALFMLAYFGKERAHYFTPQEIGVVAYLMDTAPPGSLLVEVSRNYPNQFLEYEKFTYVPVSREPWSTRERIASDPARELEEWLSGPNHSAAFVLLTRSQHNEIEMYGSMPAASNRRIEEALRASPSFSVLVESDDAVVFRLLEDVVVSS